MSNALENLLVKKNWNDILAQVEGTVSEALSKASERENALEEFIQSSRSTGTAPPSWPAILEEFLQRKHRLRELAEQSGQKVGDVDTLLAEKEEELQQWLESARLAQKNLAAWKKTADGK